MKLASLGRTLLIQPLPGIGDMVWHLPHIHALARTAVDGQIDVLAKPRSRADQLLGADSSVRRILWLERDAGLHSGWMGTRRLVALLRSGDYRQVWLLHDSARYALLAWLAGIVERFGYGFGAQRLWLKKPGLPSKYRYDHPITKANTLLDLYGISRIAGDEKLCLDIQKRQEITSRFAHLPQPWIALGIGSSESWKQWGEANFVALAGEINRRGWGSPILIGGGPREASLATQIEAKVRDAGGSILNGVDLTVAETAALISCTRLYIGNDTGFLNVAAALGINALGLFGSSPPLSYSPFIHVIAPGDGRGCDYHSRNMAGIAVEVVVQRAARLLVG
ncbi:putative Glycosyl transferase family 9 [Candidatus Competibacter denitrificans Run_A_D11]|uniref:Glycosyl transferase family 9 n=1 Tax=Candidatus Competibacter denitrificans Run_A_D11 TaxID=1400863 RepID=W6M8P5_9GAMM|nr:glycosyltransferase family 9 protein [Candidatus Competibacter denitrificans]CDI02060.1 putative Glycosyl transferase family 9 [Candidatus Competibacter denitrificans Run_A_D11]HAS85438.1 glycosyltransferase family 9 protein [Candidatus Competibacteraceae bacterium]